MQRGVEMLLVLDESLLDNINNVEQRDDVVSALEEVALSFSKGVHLVFATRRILDSFRNCDLLSITTKKVFQKLYEKNAQLGIYRGFFSRQLKIVVSDVNIFTEEQGDVKFICVSTKFIRQKLFLTSLPLFLTENIIDSRFYKLLAQVYLVRSRASVKLVYCPRGGGGSQIYNEYFSIQEEQNYLCLCIADSDVKFPRGHLGDTAQRLCEVENPDMLLCETAILEVREIENLLPIPALSLVVDGTAERRCFLNNLETMIARKKGYEFFIDFKRGLSLKSIYEAEDDNYQNYWNSLPTEIGINTPCVAQQHCNDVDNCHCGVPGFGNQTLENTLEKLSNMTPHKFSEMINDELLCEYLRLGQIISAWFCAPSVPMRI